MVVTQLTDNSYYEYDPYVSGSNVVWRGYDGSDNEIFLAVMEQAIIYVDDDAPGGGNGRTWQTAYNCLQDALNVALSGDEIWVAQGIYKPDQGIGITPGNRYATFQLKNGVTLKGGYAGYGQPDPNARDIELHETILSGDLNSDDIEIANPQDLEHEPSRAENSYHVVTGSGCDASAALDGFVVIGGNANSSYWGGGGMLNNPGSPRVSNCKFIGNYADDGGGMYNRGHDGECNPILINCVFSGNYAGDEDGGGMYNMDSNPMLTNCTFSGNATDDDGGGMYNSGSSPILTDCTFNGNACSGSGGAMENRFGSKPTLTNCTFIGNSAKYGGGGMGNRLDSNTTLTGCTFTDNSAGSDGGGICNYLSFPTLTNCTFTENSAASRGGGVYNQYDSSPTLNNCTFFKNSALHGGAMYNDGEDGSCNPVMNNCTFNDNTADDYGGAIGNSYSSPTLTNCTFTANSAHWRGGAMYNIVGSLVLKNCVFSGNSADSGGGMDNSFNTLVLNNCLFTGNSGEYVGGIDNFNNHLFLTNCTFAGNSSVTISSSHYCILDITSCIFWGNAGAAISSYDEVVVTVNYSDLQGGWPGEGNIDIDPCFTDPGYWGNRDDPNIVVEPNDPNAVWVDGDYHLLPGSPCINTGDPNYVPEPNETDLDGKPRVIGGRIDMGAYESPIPAEVRIVPRTLNLTSKGNWITCYIWLPEGYDVADIDPNSIRLEDEIEPESLKIDEQQQVVVVKFNRSEVQAILTSGEVEMTVSGELTDRTRFEGNDIIRVIDKADKK
jgi:hypothetical protein